MIFEMNFWHVHESKKSYDSINGWITINFLAAYIVNSKKLYNLPEKMLEITFVSYFHEQVKKGTPISKSLATKKRGFDSFWARYTKFSSNGHFCS